MVIFSFQNITGPLQSIQILSELVLPYYGCFTIHSATEDWLLVHGKSVPKSFNQIPILFDIFFSSVVLGSTWVCNFRHNDQRSYR